MLGSMPSLGQVMLQYDRGGVFNYVPALYASILPLISGEQLILYDILYIVVLQMIHGFIIRHAGYLLQLNFFVCMYVESGTVKFVTE